MLDGNACRYKLELLFLLWRQNLMRTVITYGTFDLFHEGHRRLLERARALGDRLIVGVTSDAYDITRGKLNVIQPVLERIENVKQTGLADEILVEEYDGQKIQDIQKLGVDVFAIGSDWLGKFDYIRDYCEVVYLDRTRGVSSTQLRTASSGILRVGLVGSGKKAVSLVEEARYVSGVSVEAIWSEDRQAAQEFADGMELAWVNDTYADLLDHVEAVYISTPSCTHVDLIKQALMAGVHVLCEPPIALSFDETSSLLKLAREQKVVIIEAIKTAYTPGFLRMVAYARSGSIGKIRSVEVSCTKPLSSTRGGSIPRWANLEKLAAYPLLAVFKLLGTEYKDLSCRFLKADGVPPSSIAQLDFTYDDALASVKLGVGVRAENDLEVIGTKGSLHVPAPWWQTQHFDTRFSNPKENQAFFVRFEGDGMRYELAELASRVAKSNEQSYKLSRGEILSISAALEKAAPTNTDI